MKSSILYSVLVVVLVMFFAYNGNREVLQNDGTSSNLLVLQEAQANAAKVTCYSSINECWIFGCWDVYRCKSTNPCPSVSTDGVTDSGTCG